MRHLTYLLSIIFLVSCSNHHSPIPDSSYQLILNITESETANSGFITTFERESSRSNWEMIEFGIATVVGRNGLGWGKGLHQEESYPEFPQKEEGDGKSPAGIFSLGEVFAYQPIPKLKMPFLLVEEMTECIDDKKSAFYNQILSADSVQKDWASSERMREMGINYEQGIIVNHNQNPVESGKGSCIFIHNWTNEDTPTSGCTALAPEQLSEIIQWLNVERNPVFIQLTQAQYQQLKNEWQLPELIHK